MHSCNQLFMCTYMYLYFYLWIFMDFFFLHFVCVGSKFDICIKACLGFLVLSILKRSNQKSLIRSLADCQLCHNYSATS